MNRRTVFIESLWLSLIFMSLVSPNLVGCQEEAKKTAVTMRPVLWREPVDIETRDLKVGPGGASGRPDLSRVTLLEEKAGASMTKFRVRDAAGREWVVKTGDQSQAEIAAMRLVWAVGYFTDVTYLVPRVEITGKGMLENVRFEARPKGIKRLDEWVWLDNPFIGTHELQALKLLLAMLDNWDLKNENNRILMARDEQTGSVELRYIVSDIDARFDRSGTSPSIWHATSSASNKFLRGVKGDLIDLGYEGKHKERLTGISVADAQWLASRLVRLSEKQIEDALHAANYSPESIARLGTVLRARIAELCALNK